MVLGRYQQVGSIRIQGAGEGGVKMRDMGDEEEPTPLPSHRRPQGRAQWERKKGSARGSIERGHLYEMLQRSKEARTRILMNP